MFSRVRRRVTDPDSTFGLLAPLYVNTEKEQTTLIFSSFFALNDIICVQG
jgi:hypothetical protein